MYNVLYYVMLIRRKRHYQSHDLEALLAERGIKTEDLMPKDEEEEPVSIVSQAMLAYVLSRSS